jgi:hypothetical protein
MLQAAAGEFPNGTPTNGVTAGLENQPRLIPMKIKKHLL